MTSQTDQIQALIHDIDTVLQKANSRLPWVMSGESAQQRQILERVRGYLVDLQQYQQENRWGQPVGNLTAYDVHYQPGALSAAQPSGGDLNAQHMLQALAQDVATLRTSLMQPLQADVMTLQQQREGLLQEIQQLERQRQAIAPSGYSQAVTPEMMQMLVAQLRDSLSQQIAQAFSAYGASGLGTPSLSLDVATSNQLHQLQTHSDQLLVNLDSTLSAVFEALLRNTRAYQESLSGELDKMHSLGQQAEVMFAALVTRLAEQIRREASTQLQNTVPQAEIESQSAVASPEFPFPGMELAAAPAEVDPVVAAPSVVDQPLAASPIDHAIESWLQTASALTPSPESINSSDLEVMALNLEDLNLDAITLEVADSPTDTSGNAASATGLELSLVEPDLLTQLANASAIGDPNIDASPDSTEEIDAALHLLEQLGADFQAEPVTSVEEIEAQLDQALGVVPEEEALQPEPNPATAGLDDFYELFEQATDAVGLVKPDKSEPAPELGQVMLASNETSEADELLLELMQEPAIAPEPSIAMSDLTSEAPILNDLLIETPETSVFGQGAESATDMNRLSDLFSEESLVNLELPAESSAVPVPEPGSSASGLAIEDDYIPAAPEENLLPAESSTVNQFDLGINLDEFTFNQLNEDLLSLEGLPPIPGLSSNTGSGFTLADWSASISTSESPKEPAPSSPPPATDLLQASIEPFLDEPTPSLPKNPSSGGIDATSPFTLEGMDDLFGDAPSVTPVNPPTLPVSSTQPEALSFTLEGMDDLFGDAPSVTPVTPPELPLSSEIPGTDDVRGAAIPAFTLEGMDDLFADLPSISTSASDVTSIPVQEVLPTVVSSVSVNDLPALTLEGLDDLLDTAFQPPAVTPAPEDVSGAEVPTSPAAAGAANFTLALLDDLLVELPDPLAQGKGVNTAEFTVEQQGDVFMEVVSSPASEAATVLSQPDTGIEDAFADLLDLSIVDPAASDGASPEKKKMN